MKSFIVENLLQKSSCPSMLSFRAILIGALFLQGCQCRESVMLVSSVSMPLFQKLTFGDSQSGGVDRRGVTHWPDSLSLVVDEAVVRAGTSAKLLSAFQRAVTEGDTQALKGFLLLEIIYGDYDLLNGALQSLRDIPEDQQSAYMDVVSMLLATLRERHPDRFYPEGRA